MKVNVLFRTYSIFELIDQDTGEVVYKEVSKAKESESLMDVLGHGRAEIIENELKKLADDDKIELEYDEDGYPIEPAIRSHIISEETELVVHGDDESTVQEKDSIFADMDLPSDIELDDSTDTSEAIDLIDDDVITEALIADDEHTDAIDLTLDIQQDTPPVKEMASATIETDISDFGLDFTTPDKFESENLEGLEHTEESTDSDELEESLTTQSTYESKVSKLDNLFD